MVFPVQQKASTTGRFGNLMELYEQNYVLLRLLIPDLKIAEPQTRMSNAEGRLPLYMQLMEQSPYTSTLRLTYRFVETEGDSIRAQAEPNLLLRVYHDARTAEVVSGHIHGQQHVQRKTRGLDSSWQLNRFLYKWLRYLRYRGHQLSADYQKAAGEPVESVRDQQKSVANTGVTTSAESRADAPRPAGSGATGSSPAGSAEEKTPR